MKSKHLIILASFFTKSDGTLPLLLLAINETFLSVLFEGKARWRLAQGEGKYYLEEVHWRTGRLEDWRKVLFGREVQAERQTKAPSGHRRSDF